MGLERPCLYHQIKQCMAPCQGYISKEDYNKNVQDAISFLNGNHGHVIRDLEKQMKELAEDMEFEQAAEIRDLIKSIHHIESTQRVGDTSADDRDVIAMATDLGNECVISIFFIRSGKMIGREHYHMSGVNAEAYSTIMESFLKQYYASTPYLPKEIIIERADRGLQGHRGISERPPGKSGTHHCSPEGRQAEASQAGKGQCFSGHEPGCRQAQA